MGALDHTADAGVLHPPGSVLNLAPLGKDVPALNDRLAQAVHTERGRVLAAEDLMDDVRHCNALAFRRTP